MKPLVMFLFVVLLVGPASLISEQPADSSSSNSRTDSPSYEESGVTLSEPSRSDGFAHPFTFGATMESVSTLGAQITIANSLSRHMNLRTNFDVLMWHKWITYNGFTFPASIDMLSTSTSLDFYPFPNHGLRFSPGVLFHSLPGSFAVSLGPQAGGQFTMNGHTYYTVATPCPKCDPLATWPGPQPTFAYEDLHVRNAAFTMTTGWGNMIPRKKAGPWSFPVEAGVAFLGSPWLKPDIFGQICDSQYQNCQDAATNAQFQRDLNAALGSYKNRLDLLKTYPIISFGVAYSFEWSKVGN
jgi:hypothetical protein